MIVSLSLLLVEESQHSLIDKGLEQIISSKKIELRVDMIIILDISKIRKNPSSGEYPVIIMVTSSQKAI